MKDYFNKLTQRQSFQAGDMPHLPWQCSTQIIFPWYKGQKTKDIDVSQSRSGQQSDPKIPK